MPSWSERLCRFVLRALPPPFREGFSSEIVEFHRERIRDSAISGPAVTLYWIRAVMDILSGAWRERRERPPSPDRRRRKPLDATDITYAMHSIRHAPRFAMVIVAILSLGLGGSATVFGVVKAVLLDPLPYQNPDDLALIWGRMSTTSLGRITLSPPDVVDVQREADSFEQVAGAVASVRTLNGDFQPQQVRVGVVTANFFEMLGVDPGLGRFIASEDALAIGESDKESPAPTALVLSHHLWTSGFGGDPDALGRSVEVNGTPVVIVGVAPQGFELLLPPGVELSGRIDAWMPITFNMSLGRRDAQFLTILARKRTDATWEQAQASVDRVSAGWRRDHEFHRSVEMELDVAPLHEDTVSAVRPILVALTVMVSLVLLIACANVANLMFVRGLGRSKEFALRSALGGGHGRVFRQLLLEGAILGVGGLVGGIAVARGALLVLSDLQPPGVPRVETVGFDLGVTVFTSLTAVFAVMLFATIPALRLSRTDFLSTLRMGRGVGDHRRTRLQGFLVVVEISLSVVLFVGTGLMLRSFNSLKEVEPGFNPDGVLLAEVSLPGERFPGFEGRAAGYLELSSRLKAIPGVQEVGGILPAPLSGRVQSWYGPWAITEVSDEELNRNEVDYRAALPGFFESLGTRVIEGRTFTAMDNAPTASAVVVVDELMARLAWPDESALGKRLLLLRPTEGRNYERYWAEVVGVVEHIRYHDLRVNSRETIYFPWSDWGYTGSMTIKADGSVTAIGEQIRGTISIFDAGIPVVDLVSLQELVDDNMSSTAFATLLIAMFGLVAAILTAVGLFGVVSHAARQRRWEYSLRLAVGARRLQILSMVLGQGTRYAVLGCVMGVVGAIATSGLISHLLFEVAPFDPITFAATVGAMGAISLAATVIPALSATSADPTTVLRSGE